MSRRDTIIIAVLINACLLVVLFATSITKKEEPKYTSSYEAPIIPSTPQVKFEDFERTLVKETKTLEESYPLQSPLIAQEPVRVQETPVSIPLISSEAPREVKKPSPKFIEVTVKSGDYLDRIGRENNVTVQEIVSYNNLKTTQLRIGQVLKIPLKETAQTSNKSRAQVKQYIVKVGDTPWKIANDHNMQLDDLLKLNHLDKESSRHLKPGDTLYIH